MESVISQKTELTGDGEAGVHSNPGANRIEKEVTGTRSEFEIAETNFEDEAVPHLHAKTILIVVTAAWLYFAQVAFIVGCGAFGRDVGRVVGGIEDSGWIVNVTAIAIVVLSTPVSQAADYWGRRWFMIILSAIGFVGCIVLASAHSMAVAILGATIGSLGGATQALVHAIASEVLPRRYRIAGQAALNMGSALGGLIGLLSGGALTKGNPNGFRAYFYLISAIYAVATVICVIFYAPPPRELQISLTRKEKLDRMDWVGSALLTIGFTLFVTSLSWAENPYPWKDVHILAPLLVGTAFVIALVVYEWKFRKDGLFNHRLFSRDRNFFLATVCVFVEGVVFYAVNGYFVYEMTLLYETNLVIGLLHFGLDFIVYGLTCPFLGIYCNRTKQIRFPMILAFACFLTFNIAMSTTQLGSGKATWGYVVFLGLGMSMGLTTVMTAAQLSAPKDLISTCSGLIISLRSLGGAVGLAIYGAIFNSNINKILGNRIADAVLPLGFPAKSLPTLIADLSGSDTTLISEIPGINPNIIETAIRAFKQAFVDSFRLLWITAAAFAAIGLITAFFVFDPIKELNMRIDAPAEKEEDLYGISRHVTAPPER